MSGFRRHPLVSHHEAAAALGVSSGLLSRWRRAAAATDELGRPVGTVPLLYLAAIASYTRTVGRGDGVEPGAWDELRASRSAAFNEGET